MPRNVVFRAALEEESSSEDEILIIPFIKPPPVVINLGSESEDESNQSSREIGNKSLKKKSKKKKHKKDKERDNYRPTDVASLGAPTHRESSVSLPSHISKDGECLPNNEICEVISCCSQDVEPLTSNEVTHGSENVATESNTSLANDSIITSSNSMSFQNLSMEVASGSCSHFEKCIDDQSIDAEVGHGCMSTKTGVDMARSTSAQDKDRGKRVKSKERKSKGEGKSRTRTLSATQRTNEEIVNFLTTLGIQMEPSSFETPPTRRRQSRKRHPQCVPDTEVNSTDSSAANNNEAGQTFPAPLPEPRPFGAFVSVSQDFHNASVRNNNTPSKGGRDRRRRQAISGNLSDYTISFTNKDLNDINTSFQTNLMMAETSDNSGGTETLFLGLSTEKNTTSNSASTTKLNYYAEVIDAVAKGLDPTNLSPNLKPIGSSSGTTEVAPTPVSSGSETVIENDGVIDTDTIMRNEDGSGQQSGENNEVCINHDDATITNNVDYICKPLAAPNKPLQQETATTELQKELDDREKEKNQGQKHAEDIAAPVAVNVQTTELVTESNALCHLESLPYQTVDSRKDLLDNTKSDKKRKRCDIEITKVKTNESQNKAINVNVESDGKENEHQHKSQRSPERKRQKPNDDTNFRKQRSDKIATGRGHKSDAKDNADSCAYISEIQMNTSPVPDNISHESYYASTWSNHMREFYGSIYNEDFDLDIVLSSLSDSKDRWRASNDMMPPPGSKRRRVRCDNCKQFGHLIKECMEKWKHPLCHYCGQVGHTSDNHSRHGRSCPNALCLNCGRRLSRFAQKCHKCLLTSRPKRCELCYVAGHDKTMCPENWRRYHQVTSYDEYKQEEEKIKDNLKDVSREQRHSSKNSNTFKRSSAMFCANCGVRGHLFYDCLGIKFHPYPRNKPFIIREVQGAEPALTSNSMSNVTGLPISYNSRTGRTVVINSDGIDQPALTLETIQVKITNELALKHKDQKIPSVGLDNCSTTANCSSVKKTSEIVLGVQTSPKYAAVCTLSDKNKHVDSFKTAPLANINKRYPCVDKRCSNKLGQNEKCYLALMDAQAHFQLLKACQNGFLKQLEEKHQVQIAVIDVGSKIHICGRSVVEAENDLYRLLQTNMRLSPQTYHRNITQLNECNNKESHPYKHKLTREKVAINTDNCVSTTTRNSDTNTSTVQGVIVDEDECCVIAEIPAKESKKGTEKPISATLSNLPNITNRSSNLMDEDADDIAIICEPESELLCLVTGGTNKDDTDFEKKTTSSTNTSKTSSWSEYVSPLVSLSKNLEKNTTGTESYEINQTADESADDDTPEDKNPDTKGNSPDLFEYDEIDYSCFTVGLQEESEVDKTLSENANNRSELSDSDVELVEPQVTNKNVEIITIDDEEEERPPCPSTSAVVEEERVTLHKSEWITAKSDERRKNSIIKQFVQEFGVKITFEDETTTVCIQSGSERTRKLAREEFLAWLESRCLNTDYHFVRHRLDNIETSSSFNHNRNKKAKERILNLSDVQQNRFSSKPRPKKRNRSKQKMQKMGGSIVDNSSRASSSNSCSNFPLPSKKSRAASSSPVKPRGSLHSQVPNKKRNFTKSNSSNFSSSKKPFFNPRYKRYFQK